MDTRAICRYYNVLLTINEKIKELEKIIDDLKTGMYDDAYTSRTVRACIDSYTAALDDHRVFKRELIEKIDAEMEKEDK